MHIFNNANIYLSLYLFPWFLWNHPAPHHRTLAFAEWMSTLGWFAGGYANTFGRRQRYVSSGRLAPVSIDCTYKFKRFHQIEQVLGWYFFFFFLHLLLSLVIVEISIPVIIVTFTSSHLCGYIHVKCFQEFVCNIDSSWIGYLWKKFNMFFSLQLPVRESSL